MQHSGSETSSTPGTSPEATLTSEASLTCDRTTSPDTPNAISSLASEDGPSPSVSPDGLTFGIAANWPDADEFAKADGFKDFDDMLAWFTETYGSPYFQGVVHSWAPTEQ